MSNTKYVHRETKTTCKSLSNSKHAYIFHQRKRVIENSLFCCFLCAKLLIKVNVRPKGIPKHWECVCSEEDNTFSIFERVFMSSMRVGYIEKMRIKSIWRFPSRCAMELYLPHFHEKHLTTSLVLLFSFSFLSRSRLTSHDMSIQHEILNIMFGP